VPEGPTLTQLPARPAPPPPPPRAPEPPGPPPAHRSRPGRSRPGYLVPLLVALAVLVAGGGSAGAVVLAGHLSAHHPKPKHSPSPVAASSSPAAPAPDSGSGSPADLGSPAAPPSSTAPPSPPGQVTIGGTTVDISAVSTNQDATAVATTLAAYFGGINHRSYQDAWDTFSSGEQASNGSYSSWAQGESTTRDSQVTVQSIQDDGGGNLEADVDFRSQQDGQYGPVPGETCTNWTLDYHLVATSGVTSGATPVPYLIDKVTPVSGSTSTAC